MGLSKIERNTDSQQLRSVIALILYNSSPSKIWVLWKSGCSPSLGPACDESPWRSRWKQMKRSESECCSLQVALQRRMQNYSETFRIGQHVRLTQNRICAMAKWLHTSPNSIVGYSRAKKSGERLSRRRLALSDLEIKRKRRCKWASNRKKTCVRSGEFLREKRGK